MQRPRRETGIGRGGIGGGRRAYRSPVGILGRDSLAGCGIYGGGPPARWSGG
jgi:hypothetical protein